MTKDIVAGLGEIGTPISQLLSKGTKVSGFDINPKLVNKKQNKKYESLQTRFLHVCIPFNKKFEKNIISLYITGIGSFDCSFFVVPGLTVL